jgi:HD-GYP domain-containing protein (c-di-GMP phosphodiesterase class II)
MVAAQQELLRTLSGQASWGGKPSTLIAEASVALARAIDLPVGELERIRTASLLHDLGKLAIPEEILAKPGDLAASEWRVVAEHPKIGQVVLEQAGALRDAATIVLHHHEWYDGRGYPHGLTGGEIPIGARIVSIVDAYEAMIAGRPYREAIDHPAAIAELRRQAGVQFDPELVEIFAVIFDAGVPWNPDLDGHGHDHGPDHDPARDHDHGPEPQTGAPSEPGVAVTGARGMGRPRTTAELHDSVHERRRQAI